MLALATGKTRSSAGEPAGLVSHCTSIHSSAEPQGISWTERAANYRKFPCSICFCWRGTGHPLQACWKHMPLLQAGKHPLSFPASTHRPWRTELSLPQTCQALTMEPSELSCWLSLQEPRKQVPKEALSKPPAFLLLEQLQEDSNITGVLYICIYMYIVISRVLMTSRTGSFAAWMGARQSSGSPWGQELLLSFLYLATLFTKTDKDQSRRLK